MKPDCRYCEHARVKYIFKEPMTVADIIRNGFVTFPKVHGSGPTNPLKMDIFCRKGYWVSMFGDEIRFNSTGALDGSYIQTAAAGCKQFEEMD